MKTSKLSLLAAALALPLLIKAQSPVPPLLYAQTSPVTVANTSDYAPISSGTFYGNKTLNYSSLAVGQTIRLRASGYISTAPGTQSVLPFVVFGGGARALASNYVSIPGGLSNAFFELDVTLTISDMHPPLWFGAYGSCKITVGAMVHAAPFAGQTLPSVNQFPTTADVDWAFGFSRADPSNSLTITTLVTEYLR